MYAGNKFRVLTPNREFLPMAVYEVCEATYDDVDKAISHARRLAADGCACIVQKLEWKEVPTQEWRYAPKKEY